MHQQVFLTNVDRLMGSFNFCSISANQDKMLRILPSFVKSIKPVRRSRAFFTRKKMEKNNADPNCQTQISDATRDGIN